MPKSGSGFWPIGGVAGFLLMSGKRAERDSGIMICLHGFSLYGALALSKLADEPDTCRYVLDMESHIACDDAYRIANDL